MQNYICILSGNLASNATLLTFSMEDIHICDSVCLGYVDGIKLSTLQANIKGKTFKTQKYAKIFKFWFYALFLLLVSMKKIYILNT